MSRVFSYFLKIFFCASPTYASFSPVFIRFFPASPFFHNSLRFLFHSTTRLVAVLQPKISAPPLQPIRFSLLRPSLCSNDYSFSQLDEFLECLLAPTLGLCCANTRNRNRFANTCSPWKLAFAPTHAKMAPTKRPG